MQSYSTVRVSAVAGKFDAAVGGLIGSNGGTVTQAYSSGRVRSDGNRRRESNGEAGASGCESEKYFVSRQRVFSAFQSQLVRETVQSGGLLIR